MEKNILILKPHSIVDIITNSSSELFVCGADKTEQFIHDLIAEHSDKTDTISSYKLYRLDKENIQEFFRNFLEWGIYCVFDLELSQKISDLNARIEQTEKRKKYPLERTEEKIKESREHNSRIDEEINLLISKFIEENMADIENNLSGRLIIESDGDNSIYYATCDLLERELNALRLHF